MSICLSQLPPCSSSPLNPPQCNFQLPQHGKVWDLRNLGNEATLLFPDPTSNGPSNDTGDSRTWTRRWNCWSGRRASTAGPQGQVHVPAGHTHPPPVHCPHHHHLLHPPPPPPQCNAPDNDFAQQSTGKLTPPRLPTHPPPPQRSISHSEVRPDCNLEKIDK